jgi:hypothetical protein
VLYNIPENTFFSYGEEILSLKYLSAPNAAAKYQQSSHCFFQLTSICLPLQRKIQSRANQM